MRKAFTAIGLGLLLAIGSGSSALAQEAEAPRPFEIAPGVTAEGLAFIEGESEPTLYRLRFAPAVTYEIAPDPSIALVTAESGEITLTLDREVTIDTLTETASPAETVPAGQEAVLAQGSYVVLPPMASGRVRNDGSASASVLVAVIDTGSVVSTTDSLGSPAPSPGIVGATDAKSGAFCELEYMRADSGWAAYGKPDGILGSEAITLLPGTSKTFLTDWKYEKTRNNGSNYYGSHLRRTVNRGNRPVRVRVNRLGVTNWETLEAGTWDEWRADLMTVSCP